MKTSLSRIASAIANRTLNDGSDTKQLGQEVAAYLLSERRVKDLDSILRDVRLAWAENGRVEVLAYSAHPLTEDIKDSITQTLRQYAPEARDIIITEVNDPEVVGGVRFDLADRQLDLSIEAKLNKFKQLTGERA